ncbi:MAG: 2-C-methyl-D-erythritol 4-phosphate cytidylyltransferase [Porphyromonadaceae bacterium]|nr:2-C-methyl-D-erythritol 4-phosphate cytidylyltransferase [Porphyromonadaceae bacterium]
MTPRCAIVVAGGQGLRMRSDVPKQFLPLLGKPVLMHTLERFVRCEAIVLALPKTQIDYWEALCAEYRFTLPHRVVEGGATRFHSVQNALAALSEYPEGLVAIHDGVRPLVGEEIIEYAYTVAEQSGAALPYIEVVDSLRRRQSGGSTEAVVRSEYIAVQTPQTFRLERIRVAYGQPYREAFTDDASVYEAAGLGEIAIVEGAVENIKITSPKDLALAEYLLRHR